MIMVYWYSISMEATGQRIIRFEVGYGLEGHCPISPPSDLPIAISCLLSWRGVMRRASLRAAFREVDYLAEGYVARGENEVFGGLTPTKEA